MSNFNEYKHAYEAFHDNELQANDGTEDMPRWVDLPLGHTQCMFGMAPDHYRRKPKVKPADGLESYVVLSLSEHGTVFVTRFPTPNTVASFLWEKDLDRIKVYKEVKLDTLDTIKIEKILEAK